MTNIAFDTGASSKKRPPDFLLFLTVICLVAIGIVMIFSASSVTSAALPEFHHDPYYFLKRQAVWALAGMILMVFLIKVDVKILRRISPYLLLLSWVALALVLIPGVGIKVSGARRWLGMGGFSIQPSEFAKLAFILYLANFLVNRRTEARSFFKEFLPAILLTILSVLLIELEPDMGTALLIGITSLAVLFIAGSRISHILGLLLFSLPAVTALILSKGYRFKRLLAFMNPWKDPQDTGYHIIQSLLALGAGGVWGVGLGKSKQKFFYLPEQHTDYIYAIIGEELGLIGGIIILFLLFFLCYRAFKIFKEASDPFSSLLAGGIASMFSFQTLLNLGVVTNLLPPTGVPLPFLSFGGSSLVCNLMAVGILLNISRFTCKNRIEKPNHKWTLITSNKDGVRHIETVEQGQHLGSPRGCP